jgi:AraC-like DNA-binding protein
MFSNDYLALRLLRLKPRETWQSRGTGLCFLFPKGGPGMFASTAINHPLAPGDVLVFWQAQGDKVSAMDAEGLVFWRFSLCLELLYPLFGSEELSLLQAVTERFRTPRLYAASTPLAQECHRLLATVPPGDHLAHRGQLLWVVTAILAAEFKEARRRRGGIGGVGEHIIQMFEELLVADIMEFGVVELAGKFHCSSRHLNRLFQQHFGFSVAALRMEMRLIKAVTLLRNRDAKVVHVAKECGFNHLGLFNSCFRRRFGTSPGRWRDANVPAHSDQAGLFEADPLCRIGASGLCPWAAKPSGLQPPCPKPARLSSSQLLEAHSPSGPPAPQCRNGSEVAGADAKPGTGVGKDLRAILAKKVEAVVRAKLGPASPLTSGRSDGL